MEETQSANKIGRDALAAWQKAIHSNVYRSDADFIHSIQFCFAEQSSQIHAELTHFGELIATQLEPLVAENHLADNLPRIEAYNGIGQSIEKIIHHPSYQQAGDIIYGSRLLSHLTNPGGLRHCLSLFFLSSQAGEAGHNCPIACSAGILRVLQKVGDFPNKSHFIEKLIAPSYQDNFTGAQFLTEVQGGSDVGLNATYAQQENSQWRIYGEKWFCSNANAELIFVTARFDNNTPGTRGLGLFLIPARWNNHRNHYTFRRLKDKLGTRTLATAEVDFHGAYAYPMGLEDGFRLMMENVLHISRLFNSFCVLGMARRAYGIARAYAHYRTAFSESIIHYPAVKETLASIKAENNAMLAGLFATADLQDQYDRSNAHDDKMSLLLRLLVNIQKYLTAKWSVQHTHHALDILAGNGTIETFSAIPRLLRDCIICENWEGTHNVLHLQVLKDLHKYAIDKLYFNYLYEQIARLDQQSPYTEMINKAIQDFEKELADFRQLDNQLQLLRIHLIIDRMTILFCLLHLLFEALDQLKTQNSASKLDCLQLCWIKHVNNNPVIYNQDYLALITRINNSEAMVNDNA